MAQGSAATRTPELDDQVAIPADPVTGAARVALIRLCAAGYASMFQVMAAVALVMAPVFAITSKATTVERKEALS